VESPISRPLWQQAIIVGGGMEWRFVIESNPGRLLVLKF
jgi:hypothetical protein